MHILFLALTAVVVVGLLLALVFLRRYRRLQREAFIRHFELPKGLFEKLRVKHPSLSTKDCQLVAHGLRQFFLAHLLSGRRFVSMPSEVVDDLWHEFILHTRNYEVFCRQAFGAFLHHTPAVVLAGGQSQQNEGLRRCWWYACKDENINPREPTRLPLLFALDAKLNIPGGFRYMPDCQGVRRTDAGGSTVATTYCGGEFASSSYDGGTAGFGDGASDGGAGHGSSSSDGGSADSSGCGGGGCGGGGD
jgi:hypothetical protein